MELHFPIIFFIFSIVNLGIHGESPEMYWKKALPDVPIPKAITHSLAGVTVATDSIHKLVHVGPFKSYDNYRFSAADIGLPADPTVVIFFFQKDLKPGTKMTLRFPNTDDVPTFLPRHVASSIPFSSAQFSTILRRFSLSPDSEEARAMKQTLIDCDHNGVVLGEEEYCPTSLESMVDFVVSKIGKKGVTAISTDVGLDDGKKKVFSVTAVKELTSTNGGGVLACHKERYPYAVFYCHTTPQTATYILELAAGEKVVKAVAVCHKDTSAWNPNHLSFKVLKVKPGSVPICHILPKEHVIWLQN